MASPHGEEVITDMHEDMTRQLVADRVEALLADARRARHRRVRRAERTSAAGRALARRRWWVALQALLAR
jgi:hypothetical protein